MYYVLYNKYRKWRQLQHGKAKSEKEEETRKGASWKLEDSLFSFLKNSNFTFPVSPMKDSQ